MQTLLIGIVHWNEIRISMKQIECTADIDSSVIAEPKTKHLLKLLEVLLDSLNVIMIMKSKGIYLFNFFITAYLGICAASLLSKAWSLYCEYSEFKKFEKGAFASMQEYCLENGKEEDCGLCLGKMSLAVKLHCGHCFHKLCIMQMIQNERRTCPICKKPIRKQFASIRGNRWTEQIILENLMENVFRPLINQREDTRINEDDIERVRRVYPSLSRGEIANELINAGNLEQESLIFQKGFN